MSFKSEMLHAVANRVEALAQTQFDNEDVWYAFQICIGAHNGFFQRFAAITKVPVETCSQWQHLNVELPESEVTQTYLRIATKILRQAAEQEKRELGEA